MPFKSKAQMRFMFANHPRMARDFATKTRRKQTLPERINSRRPSPMMRALLRKRRGRQA
jgi:hypothetical protein